MPNIGDKLEEARKRQGISVREASEATKIRSDFLVNFENNQFDFDMPEVYKRGFLKLYARYLKLDTEKVMTDYNAVLLGNAKTGKRENREFFGRMDLPPSEEPKVEISEPTPSKPEPATRPPRPERPERASNDFESKTDSSIYWKIGLVVAGTFVLIALLAMLMKVLISPEQPVDDNPADTTPEVVSTVDDAPDILSDVPQLGQVTIIASGDTRVVVRQEKDGEKLFSGPLANGESISFERDGVIRVVSPEIENVTVEIDGERYRSNQTGLRQTWYGMDGPVPPPQ